MPIHIVDAYLNVQLKRARLNVISKSTYHQVVLYFPSPSSASRRHTGSIRWALEIRAVRDMWEGWPYALLYPFPLIAFEADYFDIKSQSKK